MGSARFCVASWLGHGLGPARPQAASCSVLVKGGEDGLGVLSKDAGETGAVKW